MVETLTAVLGSPIVSAVAAGVFRGLRVIAYHDVASAEQFETNLRAVLRMCDPVDPASFGGSETQSDSGRNGPNRNDVLVTFDDGHASVVDNGLPVLLRLGVPAVMFVSPGIADGDRVFWWDAVEHAEENGLRSRIAPELSTDLPLVSALKHVPDATRRMITERAMQADGGNVPRRAATPEQLRAWLDAGMSLGNHTWDHPCLDRCDPVEQRQQVEKAHDWLHRFTGAAPRLFAYPNGDWTEASEAVLGELEYDAAFLFDHRVDRNTHPLRHSRLRLDANATTSRTRAIVSGSHPAIFNLRPGHTGSIPSGRS